MAQTNLCLACGKPGESAECDRCGNRAVDRETLADLAHRLWVHWSNHIAIEEPISEDRVSRWQDLWVDYEDLGEGMKDKDRELVEEMLRDKRHPEEKWVDHD